MGGTILPLLRLPSWYAQGQLRLSSILSYLKAHWNSVVKLLRYQHQWLIWNIIAMKDTISMYLQCYLPTDFVQITLMTGKALQRYWTLHSNYISWEALLSTVRCCLPYAAVYRALLSTVRCCLPRAAVYRALWTFLRCNISAIYLYHLTFLLVTKPAFFIS